MAEFAPFSLADAYGKAQAIRQGQQQEQMQAMQMQQLVEAQARQQRIRGRLSDLVDPQSGNVDMQKAAGVLIPEGDYHTLSALAAFQKANTDRQQSSAGERHLSKVLDYATKKRRGVQTSPEEDASARASYETLTTPKIGPDGSLMQPQLSVGDIFGQNTPNPGAPRPGAAPSPYRTDPYGTPRAVVSPGVKPTERLNDDVRKFSEDLQKNKFPQTMASVRVLNDTLSKYTPATLPGVGYGKNFDMANVALSPKGKLVKSQIQAVTNDLLNMYSGLAVTVPEDLRRSLEMMKSPQFSAEDFYAAWPTVVNRMNDMVGNATAGTPKEVLDAYSARPNAPKIDRIDPPKPKGSGNAKGRPPLDSFLKR